MRHRTDLLEKTVTMPPPAYVGRFAPSPTGPLHIGSLLTAVASYLDARAHAGQWLLRIEDLDTDRIQPEATGEIQQQLEDHGLEWDGPVVYQSHRHELYAAAIEQLRRQQHIFYCTCSRSQLRAVPGSAYPGFCHACRRAPDQPYAIRVFTAGAQPYSEDRWQGTITGSLQSLGGDFVIRRKEGYYAYHLAVCVDDADQGVTDVVRGCDLLESTLCHVYLQQLLGLPRPRYAHVPIITNNDGQKLSKQTFAPALQASDASANLWLCLDLLGQAPPPTLKHSSPAELLAWGQHHWQPETLVGRNSQVLLHPAVS